MFDEKVKKILKKKILKKIIVGLVVIFSHIQ